MNDEAETVDAPEAGGKPDRPSRFAWGMSLGLAIGVLSVAAIVGVVVIVAMVLTSRFSARMMSGGVDGSKVEYVQSQQPWVRMKDSTHGQITGVATGASGSGDGMPHGAVADFALGAMTVQDGVPAELSVRIYVTPRTTISVAGKSWNPPGPGTKSPAEAVFGSSEDGPSDEVLTMKTVTVDFVLEGNDLVASHIDASREETDFPGSYY